MDNQTVQLSLMAGREQGSRCVTFGVPWAKGAREASGTYTLTDSAGNDIALQSAIAATWPDGTVKWTRHHVNLNSAAHGAFQVHAADTAQPPRPGMAQITDEAITVDTGAAVAVFPRQGSALIQSLVCGDTVIAAEASLVAMVERREGATSTRTSLKGVIQSVELEENGPVSCVIKSAGTHCTEGGRELFPFTVRFTMYHQSPEIRITHTFLYDGDAACDFLCGLGMRFETPLSGEFYNRHVKLAGDQGFFHETLQALTSWRPRMDPSLYPRQMSGEFITLDSQDPQGQNDIKALDDITLWDRFKLTQDSSEHYVIRKRTQSDDCAFIHAAHGARSNGIAYIGDPCHGLAVGQRNFWQKYPSALWVEGMSTDTASITAWFWSPDAPAADLRHYDTKAHAGAFYEGFDELRSTPYGIANTNELVVCGFTGSIVDNECLATFVQTVQKPAVAMPSPEYMHSVRAFGTWSLVQQSTAEGRWFEAQLDRAIDFYLREVEQRKWFGFFDYGDFMHTYDAVRHVWRYDMGGYAWQNTELVPTLWLWLAFLRTGREDIFTLAEAMCRHTAEVDIYHFGEYKGLGSRHNVLHWGCACKEARIAMAGHHRYYYYITGDGRTGDVMDDVTDAEYGIERLDPLRFFYDDGLKTHARTGPDWSSLCVNWLTAWERHGNTACRDKLLKGIEGIKGAPLKLLSGSDFGFDPDTGEMIYIGENASGGSHLAICMGAPQIWMEMADSIDDPEWDAMMADYGAFYLLPPEEKQRQTNGLLNGQGFSYPYMAAAMVAYYAGRRGDAQTARKVWDILRQDWLELGLEKREIPAPFSAFALTDTPNVSTNFMAQWCLNAIMCLELIADTLDA